jgi:hypothetical protein
MAKRPVFVMSKEPPFYKEELVEFKWLRGRTLKVAKENSRSLRDAAIKKGVCVHVYEISRAGEDFSELSAFKLLVRVADGREIPFEVVYQYAKLWEGEPESVPLNSLPSSKQRVKKSRAAKKEAKERGKDKKLVGFQINFGDGVKIDFPNKPEDSFFNWLYIMALRQHHNRELHERLLRLIEAHPQQPIGFSDIFFAPHSKKVIRYNCQARAVAQYLSIYCFRKEKVQEVFPQSASLYDIRDHLRHFYDEFVHLVYPLHTESSNPIVPASHSVKSDSSSVKPNNMAAPETRNAQFTHDRSTGGDQQLSLGLEYEASPD